MKKIQKERVSYYDSYQAIDGSEFLTEEECVKYEKSAYGVLNARYKKLVINSNDEYSVFEAVGMDDHTTELVKVSSQADADTVLQMYYLVNPHILSDDNLRYKEYRDRAIKLVSEALASDGLLLIGRGFEYDDSFWIIGTPKSFQEKLNAFISCKKSEDA